MLPFSRSGTLILIVMALMAIAPSAALAASEFVTDEYPASLSGSQEGNQTLAMAAGEFSVKCEGVTYTGELLGPSEAMTLAPTYTKCTALGVETTVKAEGCVYVFHTESEKKEGTFSGPVDIVCPSGQAMTITVGAGVCKYQIGGQTGLTGAEYTNNPGASPKPTITLNLSLASVKYERKSGFLCPAGNGKDGTASGKATLKATVGGNNVGLQDMKPLNVKLCKEKPNPNCNNVYDATTVEGVIEFPAQEKAKILIGGIKVECKESKFVGDTQAKEGAPLPMANITVSFGTCKVEGGVDCGEVKMTNAATTGKITSTGKPAGMGLISPSEIVLLVICKGEVECKYDFDAPGYLAFFGGTVASIWAPELKFTKEPMGGEVGCANTAKWSATYSVAKPAGVWVSVT